MGQNLVFEEDFEDSLTGWTATGQFTIMRDSFDCATPALPFPGPIRAAYWGNLNQCNFNVNVFGGTLTFDGTIDLPAAATSASISFDSFDDVECAICQYDRRMVEVRVPGGNWVLVGEGDTLDTWYRPTYSLTGFLGSSIELRFRFESMDDVFNNGLGWLIDNVAIDVSGEPLAYCQGKVNSLGCVPFVTWTGVPSATGTEAFFVQANDTAGEVGNILYSFKKANLNYHGGKLCVKAPFARMPHKAPKASGPPPCPAVLRQNFNKRIQGGLDPLLTPGQTVFLQWRGRDPMDPAGFSDQLTDGLRFSIKP